MGESRDIAKISFAARYFFALLWTHMDDEGRVEWLPKKLAGVMYAHDEDVDQSMLNAWLSECQKAGLLISYTVEDQVYVCSPKFKSHQKPERPQQSKLPPPPDSIDDSPTIHRIDTDNTPHEQRIDTEDATSVVVVGEVVVDGEVVVVVDGEGDARDAVKKQRKPRSTPSQKLQPFLEMDLPECLDSDDGRDYWRLFCEHRLGKGFKPNSFTENAAELILKQLASYSGDVAKEAIRKSITSGWAGVFPESVKIKPPGKPQRETAQEEHERIMKEFYGK
jgi:hypothetical protein